MLVATDLKSWLSINRPTADATTDGGAIQDSAHASGGVHGAYVEIAAADDLEVLSDGADTRDVTIFGRLAGALVSETITLTGASPALGVQQFDAILRVTLSVKSATRTVTVRRQPSGANIVTLGVNELGTSAIFYNAQGPASSPVARYELVYLQNEGASRLFNATVELVTDAQALVRFGVATAKGDRGTISDRVQVAAPDSVTIVDDNTIMGVPTGFLDPGERIGIWVEQLLQVATPTFKNTFSLRLAGETL